MTCNVFRSLICLLSISNGMEFLDEPPDWLYEEGWITYAESKELEAFRNEPEDPSDSKRNMAQNMSGGFQSNAKWDSVGRRSQENWKCHVSRNALQGEIRGDTLPRTYSILWAEEELRIGFGHFGSQELQLQKGLQPLFGGWVSAFAKPWSFHLGVSSDTFALLGAGYRDSRIYLFQNHLSQSIGFHHPSLQFWIPRSRLGSLFWARGSHSIKRTGKVDWKIFARSGDSIEACPFQIPSHLQKLSWTQNFGVNIALEEWVLKYRNRLEIPNDDPLIHWNETHLTRNRKHASLDFFILHRRSSPSFGMESNWHGWTGMARWNPGGPESWIPELQAGRILFKKPQEKATLELRLPADFQTKRQAFLKSSLQARAWMEHLDWSLYSSFILDWRSGTFRWKDIGASMKAQL